MLVGLALLLSCERRPESTPETIDSHQKLLTLSEARGYYEDSKSQKKTLAKTMSIEKNASGQVKSEYDEELLWDDAFNNEEVPGYPVIVVPFKGNSVNVKYLDGMNPKGFRLMAFQHSPNHEVRTNIREMHPDVEYLETKAQQKSITPDVENTYLGYKQLIDNYDFTGYIVVYSSENNFETLLRIENARIVQAYKAK